MEFNQPKGIYQQIADQLSDRILQGEWKDGERIPSIRELAVEMGVNPNTVTRSYQSLMEREIIENRRGIGYFVSTAARKNILQERKLEFVREDLPALFSTMRLLDIGIEEIREYYSKFEQEENKDEA
jgi:DNA-binding transcriptional regulator YhcF (GntR family)